MGTEEQLMAISGLDGRYAGKVAELAPIVSEFGLIERRVAVEVGWLSRLGTGILPDVEPLGDVAQQRLTEVVTGFSLADAKEVKAIEAVENHDVKALEKFLTRKLRGDEHFKRYLTLIHFCLTSEDPNNLAYGMQIRDTRDSVLMPGINGIAETLEEGAEKYADLPMLSHTHGQPATPTTLGKEMRVFSERLRASMKRLEAVTMYGKLNSATGNYNAMYFTYPEVDWLQVTGEFVRSFGFEVNSTTTQSEPHDWIAAFCNEVALGNTVMIDLARDFWEYISRKYLAQRVVVGETGSSIMPHKVNPIDFENAEGNLGKANSGLTHLAAKLPISRMQRDLSDSTVLRTMGEDFGRTLLAYKSLTKGLDKIYANPEALASDLDEEWSVLTEAVQSTMRRYGIDGAYDIIREVTRGRHLTEAEYVRLVASIEGLPTDARRRLLELTPHTYIGLAPDIARKNV